MSKAIMLKPDLGYLNLDSERALYQLPVAELIDEAVKNYEGILSDSGALAINTGKFTGRSPKDRFIVYDDITRDTVFWGDTNFRFEPQEFDALYKKVTDHIEKKNYYVRDTYACAYEPYRISIRVITENAYQSLFANNLFLRFDEDLRDGGSYDPLKSNPQWTIIAAPSFEADPDTDGTRQTNFSILNFSKKIILIGGTGYTGEIKKGIFSILNFILPEYENTLSMHCSANVGPAGDTAIFFGLSGTGKTTLSADPERALIGDDEHGWSHDGILFNFEGGCYAKCANLTAEKEPQIFDAIRFGALLENISFFDGTRTVDFKNIDKTENTRVAYPLDFISNARIPSVAKAPENIFFLTADACGVLPPISKLNAGQAMFHFISGYTAKVAGTEAGINEPQLTFSACFGKAFLPLHPTKYAKLLGHKMKENNVNVWMVNTGWSGGSFGEGKRMELTYTRAMISAALKGELNDMEFNADPVFGLMIPSHCPNVPSEILNPRNTWNNKNKYDKRANELAQAFADNFKQFEMHANEEILSAMPSVSKSEYAGN